MIELELEKTYLAKRLPEGLERAPHKEIIDIYVPASAEHPHLRIRKRGDSYEITKKQPAKEGDSSAQHEHTIHLDEAEFNALSERADAKRVRKIRYAYDHQGRKGEIDVFQDALEGLVLVDFEFADEASKEAFDMPDFCLADVTQETAFAGGMLCGKSYQDIEGSLRAFGYARLVLE